MTAVSITGGCLCGAVRYRLDQPPEGSMICHCRTCRKVSGAPIVAWLSLPSISFVVEAGEPKVFKSSPEVTRRFCGTCGTPLTYEHSDSPDEVDVATTTLDEANAFPPTHHSWLEHDLDWIRFGDGLPAFRRSRYS
jgi:hypothetical protein